MKPNDKTRMVCLVREEEVIKSNVTVRYDLMSKHFPSIWLEFRDDAPRSDDGLTDDSISF